MTESFVLPRQTNWKRIVIGGLLSASPSVIMLLLDTLETFLPKWVNGISILLMYGLFLPAFPLAMLARTSNIWVWSVSSMVVWFAIGAVLTSIIKNNLLVVVCWVIIFVILVFISGALCVFCF